MKKLIIIALAVLCILLAMGKISFKKEETTFYDVNKLEVKEMDGYEVFSDISNYSNVVESIQVGTMYNAKLDLTGKVSVNGYTSEKVINGTLDIDNVIDIIEFNIPAMEQEQLLYLLTDEGFVYSYRFGNIDTEDYSVIKVDEVENVQKLFVSQYSKENAGGSWALFAITSDDECIMINGSSV